MRTHWKRTPCLLLAVLLVTAALSSVPAKAAGGSLDMGDVIQLGDYESCSLHIVFYPKALETSDQTWPVVVWANGTMCAPVLYTSLLKNLAAQGFIVVTNSDVMNGNGKTQVAALDWILAQNANPESVFYGKVDTLRLAAAGHSQGGRSVVNACAADSRFACAVSIAGSPYASEAKKLNTPTLFLTGTLDTIVLAAMWVKPAYNNCKGPAVYASLKNGIHTTCMLSADKYVGYMTLWLRAWLDGDAAAMNAFRPGGALSADKGWTSFACKGI